MSDNQKVEQSGKTAPDKAKKADKKSKPGFFSRVGRWLREMKSELKKVQWPSAKTTMRNTGIVILCVLLVGVFIWIFDAVAGAIIEFLINQFQG